MNALLPDRRRGFTLLELLVVIAILAILAGGMVASYDGLTDRAEDSVISHSIKGVDQAIRQYVAVNKQNPNSWDSLMFSEAGTGMDGQYLNILSSDLTQRFTTAVSTLTASDVQSLNAAGIFNVLYVSGTASYNNTSTIPPIPNRAFDLAISGATGAYGVAATLTTGMALPVIASTTLGQQLLYQAGKLSLTQSHRVVALGLGNNTSIVGAANAGLSESPYSSEVGRLEYGRFIVLYLLASELNDGAAGIQASDYQKARLVGVIDAKGHFFDQAVAGALGLQAGD